MENIFNDIEFGPNINTEINTPYSNLNTYKGDFKPSNFRVCDYNTDINNRIYIYDEVQITCDINSMLLAGNYNNKLTYFVSDTEDDGNLISLMDDRGHYYWEEACLFRKI